MAARFVLRGIRSRSRRRHGKATRRKTAARHSFDGQSAPRDGASLNGAPSWRDIPFTDRPHRLARQAGVSKYPCGAPACWTTTVVVLSGEWSGASSAVLEFEGVSIDRFDLIRCNDAGKKDRAINPARNNRRDGELSIAREPAPHRGVADSRRSTHCVKCAEATASWNNSVRAAEMSWPRPTS
jgi:hypothetical protein